MSSITRFRPAPAAEVLELEGAFDMANIGAVAVQFDAAFDAGAATVIVDLRNVAFLDSSMLNFLQRSLRRMQGERRQLLLVRPPAPVWRAFEVTRLDGLFASVESVDAALFRATV